MMPGTEISSGTIPGKIAPLPIGVLGSAVCARAQSNGCRGQAVRTFPKTNNASC